MSNPTCTRCFKETAECSTCKGKGEISNLGLWEPSPCSRCNGTGYRCEAGGDGEYWNS